MLAAENQLPGGRWQPGRLLRATEWLADSPEGSTWILRTLAGTGDLAPTDLPPPWSFHLGLPTTFGTATCTHLANGFHITFPHLVNAPTVACLFAAPGVLIGQSTVPLHPTLFSPEHEVHHSEQSTEIPTLPVPLRMTVQHDGQTSRFLLSSRPGPPPTFAEFADLDLGAALNAHASRLAPVLNRFPAGSLQRSMLLQAAETLIYHLHRHPQDRACWSAFNPGTDEAMHLHQLLGLVQAWTLLDPEVALSLVRTAVQELARHPELVTRIQPGSSGTVAGGCPLPALGVTLRWLADQAPDRIAEDLAILVPRVEPILDRMIHALDPDADGSARWPSEASAWIPDTYDENLCSVDAGALLIAEIEAFLVLADRDPAMNVDRAGYEAVLQRLGDQARTALWHPEQGTFRNRYLGGEPVARRALGSWLSLLPERAPAELIGRVKVNVQGNTELIHATGFTLWEAWPDDEVPAPVTAAHQQWILMALDREETQDPRRVMGERITLALEGHFQENGTLALELRSGRAAPADPQAPDWHESPPMAAALTLCALIHHSPQKAEVTVAPWLIALNRYRVAVLSLIGGALALAVVAVALRVSASGLHAAPQDKEASVKGLLQHLISQQEYDQALALLDEQDDPEAVPELAWVKSNLLFRKGELGEAEQRYRAHRERGEHPEKATLNLALALYQQGRLDEALALYRELEATCKESHPELSLRAGIAAKFIRVHRPTLSLAREKPLVESGE